MSVEENAVEGAKKATGDDSITVAGWFTPRGYRGRKMAGMYVGGDVGSGVGDLVGGMDGDLIGDAVGLVAGYAVGALWGAHTNKLASGTQYGPDGKEIETSTDQAIEDTGKKQHRKWLVAASHDTVYVLWPDHMVKGVADGELHLVQTIKRDDLSVVLHARGTVRMMQLVDHSSGEAIDLEGSRIGWSHSKALIHELTTAREPTAGDIAQEHAEVEAGVG